MSVHAGKVALQYKISTFLVAIIETSTLNIVLRNSKPIIFHINLSCLIRLGVPLSKTPSELTLSNKSATGVETKN